MGVSFEGSKVPCHSELVFSLSHTCGSEASSQQLLPCYACLPATVFPAMLVVNSNSSEPQTSRLNCLGHHVLSWQ